MKNRRFNESYFGVPDPCVAKLPHVIFEPKRVCLEVVFHVIEKVPGIWGVPVPYDGNGNPTVDGADRWGLAVRCEKELRKLSKYGWFIPIRCDDNGNPMFPTGESALPMNAWSYEENQRVLTAIWKMCNYENDKIILDCNCYHSRIDSLIEAFFEIKEDITLGIDQLVEELGWFIFPIGNDEEYSVLVASTKNKKLIDRIVEQFEVRSFRYRVIG